MSDTPQTRFARNGDVHLAFQTFGQGSVDLLLVDTWVHHVEGVWEVPDFARFLRRLGSFARIIHFDRRGTGLSDPVPTQDLPDLPTQVDDAIAVLDAAGAGLAAVLGLNDGCQPGMLLAATNPERCGSLVLYGPAALQARTPDHPMGVAPEYIEDVLAMMKLRMAEGGSGTAFLAPSRLGDERFEAHLSRLQRSSVRPGVIAHFYRQSMEADVRPALKDVRAPTLVVHREGSSILPAELAREVAELIPGARYMGYPGEDALIWSEPGGEILAEIEEFLTGARTGAEPDRVLATVLFTDIVGSTDMAAEVGDRRWRDLIDHHDEIVRRELERLRGTEVNTVGDGFLATFDTQDGRSTAPWPSPKRSSPPAFASAPECTPARWRCVDQTSAGWR